MRASVKGHRGERLLRRNRGTAAWGSRRRSRRLQTSCSCNECNERDALTLTLFTGVNTTLYSCSVMSELYSEQIEGNEYEYNYDYLNTLLNVVVLVDRIGESVREPLVQVVHRVQPAQLLQALRRQIERARRLLFTPAPFWRLPHVRRFAQPARPHRSTRNSTHIKQNTKQALFAFAVAETERQPY